MEDFFKDFDDDNNSKAVIDPPSKTSQSDGSSAGRSSSQSTQSGGSSTGRSQSNGRGSYAEEIFSKKIEATKFRTYFFDLKQSIYGKFLKISERSKGRKSTIMIDVEHIDDFIQALEEAKSNL